LSSVCMYDEVRERERREKKSHHHDSLGQIVLVETEKKEN